jgi:ribosome-binding factor A
VASASIIAPTCKRETFSKYLKPWKSRDLSERQRRMDQIRRKRLEELLKEEISRLITSGEVRDPRVSSLVSITRVEAARDGSSAKVWVSCFSDEDDGSVLAAQGLSSAAGFIQSQIAKRVRLRLTPILHFLGDSGIREGFEMTEKIKGLIKE